MFSRSWLCSGETAGLPCSPTCLIYGLFAAPIRTVRPVRRLICAASVSLNLKGTEVSLRMAFVCEYRHLANSSTCLQWHQTIHATSVHFNRYHDKHLLSLVLRDGTSLSRHWGSVGRAVCPYVILTVHKFGEVLMGSTVCGCRGGGIRSGRLLHHAGRAELLHLRSSGRLPGLLPPGEAAPACMAPGEAAPACMAPGEAAPACMAPGEAAPACMALPASRPPLRLRESPHA